MRWLHKVIIWEKALVQLGFKKIWQYVKYQVGLRTGYYRLRTPSAGKGPKFPAQALTPQWFIQLPKPADIAGLSNGYGQRAQSVGDEICRGFVRLFGGENQPLILQPAFPIAHWSLHETGRVATPVEDIKLLWEPARFGWAIELGRAFFFSGDERYAQYFKTRYDEFRDANPLNIGPNWQSAQEVALRLMALVLSAHLMRESKVFNEEFLRGLYGDIAGHARRILATFAYSKAQDNNHLLSEAVGLCTAAVFLNNHAEAAKWKKVGKRLFFDALSRQIEPDGEYCQHSVNYHRLMLTLALWMRLLRQSEGQDLATLEYDQLRRATGWLIGHWDSRSGRASNLGHNDGSNILPLSMAGYPDYRPIIQAASAAFLHDKALPDGEWNDLMIWLGLSSKSAPKPGPIFRQFWPESRIGAAAEWGSLRVKSFINRPAHADLLHVEIWHHGWNLLLDAGTYLYNAQAPWQNALACTPVHNTVSVDGADQMTRAGRFLWLDWPKTKILATSAESIHAEHDGYKKMGVMHRRELTRISEGFWRITDLLTPCGEAPVEHEFLLHWLIPDWKYSLDDGSVAIQAPFGMISLSSVCQETGGLLQLGVVRAGVTLTGNTHDPRFGWFSPTYNQKNPAISLLFGATTMAQLSITTEIKIKEK